MKNSIRILVSGILLTGAIVVWVFLFNQQTTVLPQAPSEKITVTASFYPLAEFAKHVGGEYVDVVNMTPAGVEPHDYEPTPQEIAKIYSSQLFLYNGAGIDHWAEKISSELIKKGIVVINMTKSFELLDSLDESKQNDRVDPHIWLDPILVMKEIDMIRNALASIDPWHEMDYQKNADDYQKKLAVLDEKYRAGLASCALREVITSHAAFGYLAERYNFRVTAIAGISPEEEPAPKRIAQIAQLAKEKNIKYIFFETLVSPKLAETIAREIGIKTLVFNPLEGLTDEEIAQEETYISVMEKNLENLRSALICT